MKRQSWFGLAAGVVLAWSAASAPVGARAQDVAAGGGLTGLRHEVTELSLSLLRARALAEELKDEEVLLSASPPRSGEADTRPLSAKDKLWIQAVGKGTEAEGAGDPLAVVRESTLEAERGTVAAYRAAMEKRLAFPDKVADAERKVGRPWVASAPHAGSNSWAVLIAIGFFTVSGGLMLTTHEARDRLRMRLRAKFSRPSLIAFALVAPLAAASGVSAQAADEAVGSGTTDLAMREVAELTQRRDALKAQFAALEQANAAALRRLTPRLDEVRRERAARGLRPENPFQKSLVDRAESAEATLQDEFRATRMSARVAALAAAEAVRIERETAKDATELDNFVSGSRVGGRRDGVARLSACGFLGLAVVLPLMLVRGRRRRELKEESRRCPRCRLPDTLKPLTSDTDVGDDRLPRSRMFECESCTHQIRENYIDQHRLCFPTVGIRASGKTHWLVMLYDMIKNSNVPVASAVKKIPSHEDANFDRLVRDLLYNSGRPSPSVGGLPHPLIFHVHDADPLGPNKTLVNLFDFSGEMVHWTIDQDEYRRRALLCEGFTLFLDPTQNVEDQVQILAHFSEEMHAIRGLASERPVDLPIAVCVSKMDLLVNRNPMGTQAIPLITELRGTIGERVNLSLIQKRSRFCAGAIPQIFPGWNVERTLRENFGGRYMFFPISSVGLEGSELGVEDLGGRTIAPFGMIEPLLWLLHMHGYCVLR